MTENADYSIEVSVQVGQAEGGDTSGDGRGSYGYVNRDGDTSACGIDRW